MRVHSAGDNPGPQSRHAGALARAVLAALPALLALRPALAQPALPPDGPAENRPGDGPAAPDDAVGLRRVFPDEGVGARESLLRVQELSGAGNLGEAVRVLQGVLDGEGDQVLPMPLVRTLLGEGAARSLAFAGPGDELLHLPIRRVVHEFLLTNPPLLERYRAEQQAQAQVQLDQGDARGVARTRLLTSAGLEAALRVVQEDLESARFFTAARGLDAIDRHPDLTGEMARGAIALGLRVRARAAGERLDELLRRWSQRAGVELAAPAAPQDASPTTSGVDWRSVRGLGPLEPQPAPVWSDFAATPLQSTPWNDALVREVSGAARGGRVLLGEAAPAPRAGWIMPVAAKGVVYACDGSGILALDAVTLSPLWRTQPAPGLASRRNPMDGWWAGQNVREIEDVAGIAVARGVVVAVTGLPLSGDRVGDGRVHALDAASGRVLWSLEPAWIGDRQQAGAVRGEPLIEGDTVVLGVRRLGMFRRVTTMTLVGVELGSGRVRWQRTLGSVGTQPWGRVQDRPEGATLDRGVVYRGDDMGVLGAFDASTGEPVWVRRTTPQPELDPNQPVASEAMPAPFELLRPVVLGGSVFYIEPGRTGGVIQVDARTGALIARRGKVELGEPRYLLAAGDRLVCVGARRLVFVPAATFASAGVTSTTQLVEGELAARVAVLGADRVLAPVRTGWAEIDAQTAQVVATHATASNTGSVLVVAEASSAAADDDRAGVVLVAGERALSSHLSWERARARLDARMRATPDDPQPVLTLLELTLARGEGAEAAGLAQRALSLSAGVEAQGAVRGPARSPRQRLVEVLGRVLAASRRAGEGTPQTQGGAGDAPSNAGAPILRDAAALAALAEVQSRAAQTPADRAGALLELAWAQWAIGDGSRSIDALQEVLADPALAQVPVESGGVWSLEGSPRASMRELATRRLFELLARSGAGAYASYADEARRALDAMAPDAAPDELLALAQQYPASPASADAWLRLARAHQARTDHAQAETALGEGLRTVVRLAEIATPQLEGIATELAQALVRLPGAAATSEPRARLLRRVGALVAGASADGAPLAQAADALLAQATQRTPWPVVGERFGQRVQVIEGYEPLTPIASGEVGLSHASVVMMARDGKRVALFASGVGGGELARVWEMPVPATPAVVRVDPQRTLLLVPRVGGARLLAVSNVDGTVAWQSESFGQLPNMPEPLVRPTSPRDDRMSTPIDGVVRVDDLVVAMDPAGAVVVVAERRGRAAAWRTSDGALLWTGQLPMTALFDLDIFEGDVLLAVGAARPEARAGEPQAAATTPVVVALDARAGTRRWALPTRVLGDHARFTRALGDGSIIVGVERGLVRVRASDGQPVWREAPAGGGAGGAPSIAVAGVPSPAAVWPAGETLFVMNSEFDMFRVQLEDGSADPEPLDTRDRLTLPFQAFAPGESFTIASPMGVATFGGDGELAGLDALQAAGRLEPGVLGDGVVVAVETLAGELGGRMMGAGGIGAVGGVGGVGGLAGDASTPARLVVLSQRDARLLGERSIALAQSPTALLLLDEKVIVGQGPFTYVFDLPAPREKENAGEGATR